MRNQLFKNLRKACSILFTFVSSYSPAWQQLFFFFLSVLIQFTPYCKSNKQIRKCSSKQSVFPYVEPWPLVLEGAEQTLQELNLCVLTSLSTPRRTEVRSLHLFSLLWKSLGIEKQLCIEHTSKPVKGQRITCCCLWQRLLLKQTINMLTACEEKLGRENVWRIKGIRECPIDLEPRRPYTAQERMTVQTIKQNSKQKQQNMENRERQASFCFSFNLISAGRGRFVNTLLEN